MKRRTAQKHVFHKDRTKTKLRRISNPGIARGRGTLYEQLRASGGKMHVCIIRSVGGIGDMLMTTPLLRQLKREFSALRLTFAIDRHRVGNDGYYELLKNASFIDEFVDARFVDRSKYHAVVDISSVCIRYERKGLPVVNRIDLFARSCGVNRLRDKVPFYEVTPKESQWAGAKLSSYKKAGKHLIALHTASFEGKRSWPAANYRELIKHCAEHRPDICFIIFDFNNVLPNLDKYGNCVDKSNTTIREMAALINECDLFIGPDSGPMHLAGALGKQSLVLFGSIPPEARINYYKHHTALVANLPCLGCWYASCDIGVKCMVDLSYLTIFNALLDRI